MAFNRNFGKYGKLYLYEGEYSAKKKTSNLKAFSHLIISNFLSCDETVHFNEISG